MNLDVLGSIGIGLLVLVWVGYRQTTWRAVDAARMWRLPAILGIVGVVTLVGTGVTVNGIDLAALVVELVIAAATGVWMGVLAHFRPVAPGRWESRTGWWGLALWLLVIGVRVGIDVLAVHLGATSVTSTGIIMLVIAVNRLARVAVVLSRAARLETPASAQARGRMSV